MDNVDECNLQSRIIAQSLSKSESNWTDSSDVTNTSNQTLLYIAVEYVKEECKGLTYLDVNSSDNLLSVQQHVSMLDPNMSSVARFSPVYSTYDSEVKNDMTFNHELSSTNSPHEGFPSVLCEADPDVNSQYGNLNMNRIENLMPIQGIPPGLEDGKEPTVEILITDQATGISYTVSTHELLVEDQQLLQTLSPSPILDSTLLTIDDSTLKNNLPENLIEANMNCGTPTSIANESIPNEVIKSEVEDKFNRKDTKIENEHLILDQKLLEESIRPKRKKTLDESETEDKLFSHVYNIIDKPILSRARATLPEDHLKITKIGEEWGVVAKKLITKRIQFGPVHGILKDRREIFSLNNKLELMVKDEDGKIMALDISDEEHSNWMCFIRKAENYEEQNLIVSHHDNQLYFTTMRNITPKQELKVGYSNTYASEFNYPVLKKNGEEEHWSCYECSEDFPTSIDLQNHLETHENDTRQKNSVKKRSSRKNRKITKSSVTEACQCRICQQIFNPPKYSTLKNHLLMKHSISEQSFEEHYLYIRNYKCEKCTVVFNSEDLLKLHNSLHTFDIDDHFDDEMNLNCPACSRKFTTQRQLVMHVSTHTLPKFKRIPERFNCPFCKTSYNLGERLQKHMLVHGPEESKPLQCSHCKKRFLNNSALVCHSKAHTSGVNIYECPVCKDRFDHLSKLKMHVQKHCVNNTYTCPHCNKKFKAYSNIRKHIRAFHNEPKYSCQHCSKSFPTMDKLKSHQLKHSDHREFLCSDCGKQFKRKDKLNDHCKKVHSEERENSAPRIKMKKPDDKEKTEPTDFHRFIYKCHHCLIGFKRRGMLVNHLAKRHPDISLDSVPELNLPILRATKDYYCQYCDKVYKSSFKRKVHILKNHPGAALPTSNRKQGAFNEVAGLPNSSFSQTVGSVTTSPQNCNWCHKQYASKAKLLQHKKKEHNHLLQQCNTKSIDEDNPPSHGDANLIENISAFQQGDLTMTERVLNTETIEEFVDDPDPNNEYCMDSTVADNDIFERSDDFTSPNSHLYRLLTTANSLVPPR